MLKLIYAAIGLALFVLALSFAALNSDPVPIDYYVGRIDVPLALLLVVSLGAGALLGSLVGLGRVFRVKREMAALRRQTRATEEEVRNLRALPLKDVR
ncbi:MAG: LapA family protein [Gammaproteobacteria bacterium]|nr:LapA family protein [Gammaproteobacteria bacterium]